MFPRESNGLVDLRNFSFGIFTNVLKVRPYNLFGCNPSELLFK